MKRLIAWTICGCLSAIGNAALAQQTFPNHPIRLIVPFPPGGSNDVVSRVIATELAVRLGQGVVIDNRGGAGGMIGTEMASKSAPDGYTLLFISSAFASSPSLYKLTYDPAKVFAPVAMIAAGPNVLVVTNAMQVKSTAELIAMAKAQPGKLNYGSSGAGSINQFATELFAEGAGVKLMHIPYKGMGPATNGLLGGQIDLLVASAPSILAQVKGGRARALAVTTGKRSPIAPDLPSLEEAGYRGSAIDLWWGVLAPAKTPAAIVDKLNAAINREIQSPEMQGFFLNEGAEPAPLKPAEFARYIAGEIDRWKAVAKKADIRPE